MAEQTNESKTPAKLLIRERRVKPLLTHEEVIAGMEEGSTTAITARKDYDAALEFAEKGNALHLLRLYEDAIRRNAQILKALMFILPMREGGEGRGPLFPMSNPDSVEAMKIVALAAVDLAKLVCNGKAVK